MSWLKSTIRTRPELGRKTAPHVAIRHGAIGLQSRTNLAVIGRMSSRVMGKLDGCRILGVSRNEDNEFVMAHAVNRFCGSMSSIDWITRLNGTLNAELIGTCEGN